MQSYICHYFSDKSTRIDSSSDSIELHSPNKIVVEPMQAAEYHQPRPYLPSQRHPKPSSPPEQLLSPQYSGGLEPSLHGTHPKKPNHRKHQTKHTNDADQAQELSHKYQRLPTPAPKFFHGNRADVLER